MKAKPHRCVGCPTPPDRSLLCYGSSGLATLSEQRRPGLERGLVGQAALSRRGGWCHTPLWHARLFSYVEANCRGGRWEETGLAWFPRPTGQPRSGLIGYLRTGEVAWLCFTVRFVGVFLKVRSGKAALGVVFFLGPTCWSCGNK